MAFEIIDFHTHPFTNEKNNICAYKEIGHMNEDTTVEIFQALGVSKICGSVICFNRGEYANPWEKVKVNNDTALKLRDYYGGFYVPGFHVHPAYVDESIEEIRRMHREGVHLIGELVPYIDEWNELDYDSEGLSAILDEAAKYHMIVNTHSGDEDATDKMVQEHPDVVFVGAHPGESDRLHRHLERMKLSENYYVDLSGTGIFRHGMVRYAIDRCGADRLLFGSDYPTCNPAMFVGAILLDPLLTDTEKEKIFSLNAKRLLQL